MSERFASVTREAFGLSPDKVIAIPNGVDLTKFEHSRSTPSASDQVVVGGCGALVEQKRFDLLIKAISRLGDRSIQVRIAGDGPQRRFLESLIDSLGLNETVRLVGHQNDIPSFLRDLDLFVMSSDYEAFPYAQLEAMASGLPSVVTDVGDLSRMVRRGQDGFVVPPGNIELLANAIGQLTHNDRLRRDFGQSARLRTETEYEQGKCERQTLDAIEQVCN